MGPRSVHPVWNCRGFRHLVALGRALLAAFSAAEALWRRGVSGLSPRRNKTLPSTIPVPLVLHPCRRVAAPLATTAHMHTTSSSTGCIQHGGCWAGAVPGCDAWFEAVPCTARKHAAVTCEQPAAGKYTTACAPACTRWPLPPRQVPHPALQRRQQLQAQDLLLRAQVRPAPRLCGESIC